MKKSAFTLIELLVVIVIIGILATIGVAQFNTYQERARQAKALAFSSQLDRLMLAETVAAAKQHPLVLNFDEGSGTKFIDSSGNNSIMNVPLGNGIDWSSDTVDGSQFSFLVDATGIKYPITESIMPIDQITYSAFFRLDQFGSTNHTYLIATDCNSGILVESNGRIKFYMNGGVTGSSVQSSTGVIDLGTWYHAAASYDGTTARLFVNGTEIESNAIPLTKNFNLGCSSESLNKVGLGYHNFTGKGFYGLIDRARVYSLGINPDQF